MTDHLEPYRRMVRSMRFFPPTSLTQLSQYSGSGLVPPAPVVNASPNRTIADADVKPALGPPIDPSQHTAALVHEAVRKPTVLPLTYKIAENIGDRISRLAPPKLVKPAIVQPKLPQADVNWVSAYNPIESGSIQAQKQELREDTRSEPATPTLVVAQPLTIEETPSNEVVSVVVTEPVETEEAPSNEQIAIVAESVEVEETPDEQVTEAVVAEFIEVEEKSSDEAASAVVAEPIETEPTPSDEAASAVVAEPIEAEPTPSNEQVAGVAESTEVEETPDQQATETVVDEPVEVTETPLDLSNTESSVTEAEDTQAPTLLEKVSSVIDAVSAAFMNPEVAQKPSEQIEPAPLDSVATEDLTAEPLATDAAEDIPAPGLLDRVTSVVEAVKTTLKPSDAQPAADETALDSKTSKTPEITCPKCESSDIRKNGRRQGKQRYVCKDCGREFVRSDSTTVEDKPKSQETSRVETLPVKGAESDTVSGDSAPELGKRQSKKKKAKGFGGSKAK